MQKLRKVLIYISVFLIIAALMRLDYSNLNWSKNKAVYLALISSLCLIIAMIASNRHERKIERKN